MIDRQTLTHFETVMNRHSTHYDFIYRVIRRIPRGRVSTYGHISSLAGITGQPRMVGYALARLPDHLDVPWHRVLNFRGEISKRSDSHSRRLQRIMLESEGVAFDANGRVSLERYLWRPKGRIE
jgi:methylated-DNA-protein-cysteine methyltransferase-like protein